MLSPTKKQKGKIKKKEKRIECIKAFKQIIDLFKTKKEIKKNILSNLQMGKEEHSKQNAMV